MQHTKIVWSLDAQKIKDYSLENISSYPCQALRILYNKENSANILSFLKEHKKAQNTVSLTNYKPIIVDVSQKPQASIIKLKDLVKLEYQKKIFLVPEGHPNGIQIKTDSWPSLFKEQELIYLNNGNVVLSTEKVFPDKIETIVQQGQNISNGMELTIPASKKPPSIFDLAFIDIEPFQKTGVDYVVLPGIASARQINIIKKKLSSKKKHSPSILLKVDSSEVYNNIKEILPSVDGLVISRRTLALSVDPATVPLICKEIIHEANKEAKIVLVSSEMLYSMRHNPTPTRAEVSDIANAVIDGTDAVVLSKEIAYGHNTLRSLDIAAKTIKEVESSLDLKQNWHKDKIKIKNNLGYIAYYAYITAKRIKAKALVCLTKEGHTALQIASYRPNIPIIALTFNEKTRSRTSLIRGVSPIVLKGKPNLDKVLPTVNNILKESGKLKAQDIFVFVTLSLSPISGEASNLFTVQEIN